MSPHGYAIISSETRPSALVGVAYPARDRDNDAALSYPSRPAELASARSRAARATGEFSK